MNIHELNPHIRYARIHKISVGTNDEVRICYDCRMFYFDNVAGSITIGEMKYDIKGKTVIFLPPETRYIFNTTFLEHGKAVILDFDLTSDHADIKSSLGTATLTTFEKSKVPSYTLPEELSDCIMETMPQLDHPLSQCAENFLLQNPFYREKSSALLKLCILEMINTSSQNSRSKTCEAVIGYIHIHYANASLTNKQIAEEFGYHPDHLSQMIRHETGRTLHQYLINYRIQVAKNYLLTTKYDIAVVAWRSGFCSTAYFIKTFKEHTGRTPRTYRLQRIHNEL